MLRSLRKLIFPTLVQVGSGGGGQLLAARRLVVTAASPPPWGGCLHVSAVAAPSACSVCVAGSSGERSSWCAEKKKVTFEVELAVFR